MSMALIHRSTGGLALKVHLAIGEEFRLQANRLLLQYFGITERLQQHINGLSWQKN